MLAELFAPNRGDADAFSTEEDEEAILSAIQSSMMRRPSVDERDDIDDDLVDLELNEDIPVDSVASEPGTPLSSIPVGRRAAPLFTPSNAPSSSSSNAAATAAGGPPLRVPSQQPPQPLLTPFDPLWRSMHSALYAAVKAEGLRDTDRLRREDAAAAAAAMKLLKEEEREGAARQSAASCGRSLTTRICPNQTNRAGMSSLTSSP